VVLVASELTLLSVWLFRSDRLTATTHDWGTSIFRCIVGLAAIVLPYGYLKNRIALEELSPQIRQTSFRWPLLAAHCSALILAVKLFSLLYSAGDVRRAHLLAAGCFAAGVAAIVFAGFAFLPWRVWAQLSRRTGHLWAYATIAVVSATLAGDTVRLWLWQPTAMVHLTLGLTKIFLSPFVSNIVVNPAKALIGTKRFRVEILSGCSGLEGMVLMLAFITVWLVVFRKECRFPRALVLIPISLALVFVLNAVRIAALILIGNAGGREIAINGFHSQAGWIAFSAVSVGFCFLIQRVPWFTAREHAPETRVAATHNPAAAFLLPFLVILGAGMIASAAKGGGGVEWLYPLRFFAAAAVLWTFRRSYQHLGWSFDWTAPAIGALVFAIWIAFDRFSGTHADSAFSSTLMGASASARVAWIALRVLAAVVTVPLAEELAFRGFLMRRLISPDFESVPPRAFGWFALLASSIAFGVLHGGYWIPGCIAGILFGLAMIRRGRIGDAVVAHAGANALLAAYVLVYHQWHLW
jgi:exosortase E/protease (VPEID-CTERM system)